MHKLRTFLRLSAADRRGVFTAWTLLLRARLLISVLGLPATLRILLPAGPRRPAPAPPARNWVTVGAKYCPAANCLVRSVAVLVLWRRAGIAADLRIGVAATHPQFEAHAWVEVDGVPVNDTPEIAQRYVPFAPGTALTPAIAAKLR